MEHALAVKTMNHLCKSVRSLEDLEGRSLYKIDVIEDREIRFYLTDDHYLRMYHEDDCCEDVYIEDICGDLEDLEGVPILLAEEVQDYQKEPLEEDKESYTWTFYRFSTRKGSVTIRWYGCSNGYYSEKVDIEVVDGEVSYR
jgi:hypothetical protein